MALPPDMKPPPIEDVPPHRRAAYLRDCLTWPLPTPNMPLMHVVWLYGGGRNNFRPDSHDFHLRTESGRSVMLSITDDQARRLLRALHRALPDEPLDPRPPFD